jgi:hypothetical protein
MSMECVDTKYIEIAVSLWSNDILLKLCTLDSQFGGHLETSRHFDFIFRYSNCIVSINFADLTYIGIDTNFMSLSLLV